MPVGNGPDIEQFDREEEDQIALQMKVDKWWYSLDESYKIELMENFNPDKVPIIIGVDEIWEDLKWQDRLDIYQEAEGFEVRV